MLSVRLPEPVERQLTRYCAEHEVTKSHVVQEALVDWLVKAEKSARGKKGKKGKPKGPDLSFLAPDDPLRQFVGILKGGPSTDEWMRITRGADWNKP